MTRPRKVLGWRLLATLALAIGLATAGALAFLSAPSLTASDKPARPLLVGYYPQWGVYNNYFVKNFVASGAASLLDQLDYSQGQIKDARCVIADPNADLAFTHTSAQSLDGKADDPNAPLRGTFHQLQLLRRKFPKLRMLLSIEGNPKFFAEAAQPQNREAFVSSCIDMFVDGRLAPGIEAGRLFDGFDLDWEFPTSADPENYLALVKEFRRQLDELHAGLKLSVTLAPGLGRFNGLDFKAVAEVADQVNMMNYDYNGPWSHTTGFIAPLYEVSGDPLHSNTVDSTIQAYEKAGVPPSKILLGIPFYAYGWSGVANVNRGLFQSGQPIHGDHFYSYIQSIQPQSRLYRDPTSQAPWLYASGTFWTFDDPLSIRAKVEYAQINKLGGMMVWELSNDSADAALLKSIAADLKQSRK